MENGKTRQKVSKRYEWFSLVNWSLKLTIWLPFHIGWVVDNMDRDWQFRISVYYAGDEDTNVFTCKTPRGRKNSINVVVTGKRKTKAADLLLGFFSPLPSGALRMIE